MSHSLAVNVLNVPQTLDSTVPPFCADLLCLHLSYAWNPRAHCTTVYGLFHLESCWKVHLYFKTTQLSVVK